jgi:DNA-binding MarR family transcriptional regulator
MQTIVIAWGCAVASSLNDSVGWLLNNAARLTARRLSGKLAGYNVTPPQWGVLVALWEQDGLSLSELAKRSFFDGPTMTGIVDRLEKANLVERRRDSTDRRVISVYLTAEGRGLQAQLPALSEEANDEALRNLPDADVERLVQTLRHIIANLS